MFDLPMILRLGLAGAAMAMGLYFLTFAKRIDDEWRRNGLKLGFSPSTRRPLKWGIRLCGFWLFTGGSAVLFEAVLRSLGIQSAG